MKKPMWLIVAGVLSIGAGLMSVASVISDPSTIIKVNYSDTIFGGLLILLGAFLLYRYTQRKEEELRIAAGSQLSSEENLEEKQNRILGYFLFFLILGSIEVWVLNDYFAGLTPINAYIIFDLLCNAILGFFAVQLFRNRLARNPLLGVLALYTIGTVIFCVYREEWWNILIQVLIVGYFTFVLVRPMNPRNYSLSNYIVLPVVLAMLIAIPTPETIRTNELWENFGKIEQDYMNQNALINSTYAIFLQSERPAKEDVADMLAKQISIESKLKDIDTALKAIEAEYQKQLVAEEQILSLEIIKLNLDYYDVVSEQGEKFKELLRYAQTLDYSRLTDEQREQLSKKRRIDIDSYNAKMNEIVVKIEEKQIELSK